MQRRAFLHEIEDALRGDQRLHLLLIMRDDAVDMITEVLDGGVIRRLAPLGISAAIEAVTKPLADTGRSFADGTARQLASGLATLGGDSKGGGHREDKIVRALASPGGMRGLVERAAARGGADHRTRGPVARRRRRGSCRVLRRGRQRGRRRPRPARR